MEQYFDYKLTKKELIELIKVNKGLANVELDNQDTYVDINVEIYPLNNVITYCRVDTTQDKQAHAQALKIAAMLNDYLDDYEKIKA